MIKETCDTKLTDCPHMRQTKAEKAKSWIFMILPFSPLFVPYEDSLLNDTTFSVRYENLLTNDLFSFGFNQI